MGVEDWIPTYHPSGTSGAERAGKTKDTQAPTANPSNNFCDKHGFLPTSDGGSSGVPTVTVEHTTSAELQKEKEDEAKVKEEAK
ncbi:hypothetical protein SMACR_07568 [Sordaria macrospora]|uniref:WGS project CABT00000000 data, contig 2.27 n=2 Tax=Sordaria macrospora TaxID=5147 RepID=F7W490_SORMK|nr:uncharacterized protein SMAC_07568 [Sordaria macrospora k-hell]KAA8634946.1 hypothetical protein SMACR_07568 [Sordaria macrospora]KAH7635407.1 hypothetical protein B0T09DRAFT_328711 [Sordaria sp. MPI-SDFR-AT-0083]WPJ67341.1 hypothetical protein SMAC4_07568 [Sordaria macrospora]CCC14843.1 unnamed protein product [Sordaria macrospora k-hell]